MMIFPVSTFDVLGGVLIMTPMMASPPGSMTTDVSDSSIISFNPSTDNRNACAFTSLLCMPSVAVCCWSSFSDAVIYEGETEKNARSSAPPAAPPDELPPPPPPLEPPPPLLPPGLGEGLGDGLGELLLSELIRCAITKSEKCGTNAKNSRGSLEELIICVLRLSHRVCVVLYVNSEMFSAVRLPMALLETLK